MPRTHATLNRDSASTTSSLLLSLEPLIPVFRTESQPHARVHDELCVRYPFEGQYQQSITIEADGFNTLAPYKTCPNANNDRARAKVAQWAGVYLAGAVGRLRPLIKGYELQVEDVYVLQQLCAHETVALGYSKFCELFTEEWDGFDYSLDLYFWYNSAFGFALGRPLGIGYVQELVAQLTHTPIATHNSSTNGTLNDDPTTFPLGQSPYVDATHEVVVLQVLTALGLSTLAAEGTLPADHIPQNRTFRSRELAPFATNVHFQLLSCTSLPARRSACLSTTASSRSRASPGAARRRTECAVWRRSRRILGRQTGSGRVMGTGTFRRSGNDNGGAAGAGSAVTEGRV